MSGTEDANELKSFERGEPISAARTDWTASD